MIGLQAGTNKYASQAGMKMGAVRHAADIKVDDMTKEGQGDHDVLGGGGGRGVPFIYMCYIVSIFLSGVIGLQAGTNKYANQSGMVIGGVRHVADIRADDLCKEGSGVIGLQMGTNKFASQSGESLLLLLYKLTLNLLVNDDKHITLQTSKA